MRFSLINVFNEMDGYVNGTWIQNHCGTLESATKLARDTEQINHNRISIAVVDEVSSVNPMLNLYSGLKRLDKAKR